MQNECFRDHQTLSFLDSRMLYRLSKAFRILIGVHDKRFRLNAGGIDFRYSPSETFILKSLVFASKVLQWKYLSTVLITCMRDWLVWKKNSEKQRSEACVCSWEQESVAHTSPAIFETKSSEYILLRIISLNDILCACDMKTRTKSHVQGNTFIGKKLMKFIKRLRLSLKKKMTKNIEPALFKSLRFASSNLCLASSYFSKTWPRFVSDSAPHARSFNEAT